MRLVKMCIVAIMLLSTILQSYPQNMLIEHCDKVEGVDIKVVDKIYKEKNDYLEINVTIPEIIGITNKNGQNNINNVITAWTQEWINEAKKNLNEIFKDGIPPSYPYELYAKYKIINMTEIISLYIDYYQFTGGAHGITVRKAYTIDNEDSGILGIKDLFKVGYDFKSVIDKEIQYQINNDKDKYFIGKDGFQGIDDKTNFYIKDGNLVIYYNQYEIAPYASGIPEFIINQDLFEGNFKYDKIN